MYQASFHEWIWRTKTNVRLNHWIRFTSSWWATSMGTMTTNSTATKIFSFTLEWRVLIEQRTAQHTCDQRWKVFHPNKYFVHLELFLRNRFSFPQAYFRFNSSMWVPASESKLPLIPQKQVLFTEMRLKILISTRLNVFEEIQHDPWYTDT